MLVLVLLWPANAAASSQSYSLAIDGDIVLEQALPPSGGVIYAPVTAVYAQLGMRTAWDASTKTAKITGYGMTVELRSGSAYALVNGETVELPGKVHLRSGQLHFPILTPQLLPDIEIRYSSASRTVYMHTALSVYAKRLANDPAIQATVQNGAGKLTGHGALIYEGRLADGLPEGAGRLYRDGKLAYEGEFKKGMPAGYGLLTDRNGSRYEGMLAEGRPDGRGTLYVHGLPAYEGEWKRGLKDGTGTEYGKSGRPIYEGEFKQGVRRGLGVSYAEDTGNRQYYGEWLNGREHGTGRLYDPKSPNLIAFTGRFADGVKEGEGQAVTVTSTDWYVFDGGVITGKESRPTVYLDSGTYRSGKLVSGTERFIYTGDRLDDGTPHGQGSFYRYIGGIPSPEGLLNDMELIYEGAVKNGQRSGRGRAYEQDRVVYEGEWVRDARSGFGRSYENGKLVYAGGWLLNQPSGRGTRYEIIRQPSGNVPGEVKLTTGEFRRGVPTESAQTYVYIGGMTEGLMSGTGKLYLVSHDGPAHYRAETFETGRKGLKVYEGQFVNGLKHGSGIQFEDGRKVYEGGFSNDVRSGAGTLYHSTTGNRVYQGEFADGVASGRGTEYSEYGVRIYEGTFAQGQRDGSGTEYAGTVMLYQGQFKNGLRHGVGTEYAAGARVYAGEFAAGKREGRGTEYDYYGRVIYEGMYLNGQRVT